MRKIKKGEKVVHRRTNVCGTVIRAEPLIHDNQKRYPDSRQWIVMQSEDGNIDYGPDEYFSLGHHTKMMEPDFSLEEIELSEKLLEEIK